MTDHQELSEREIEILRLVATGVSNKRIALELSISTNTVKVHLRNIFAKINVNSRTEAAMYAVKIGLVPQINQIDYENIAPLIQPDQDPVVLDSDQEINAKQVSYFRKNRFLIIFSLFILIGLVLFTIFIINQNRTLNELTNNSTLQGSSGWKSLAPLPVERNGLALSFVNNRIFAIGGEVKKVTTGLIERYDFEKNEWTTVTEKPTPVKNIGAAVVGGLIYVPGGELDNGKVTNVLEIYDPIENKWIEGANLPVSLSRYSLIAYEGKLYIFGGWNGKDYSRETFLFDPVLDRWEEIGPMPTQRAFLGASVAEGKAFLLGGENIDGQLSINQVFSFPSGVNTSGAWNKSESMPMERSQLGAVGLADMIFIIGGKSELGTGLPDWIFFPERREWQSFPPAVDSAWTGFGITNSGTNIFMAGGEVGGVTTSQFFTFQAIYTALLPLVPQR